MPELLDPNWIVHCADDLLVINKIDLAPMVGASLEVMQRDTERMRPVNSEVERLWADNSKVKALFGWSPKYAGRDGLVRGLQETINWFTQPENLQRYKSDIYNI